jgi:phenylacetate-CoA ligase
VATKSGPFIWRREIELLSAQELERLQFGRLESLVQRLADKVPHYRVKLKEAGMSAAKVRSLADLKNLPFTSKADLAEHYPFGLLAVPLDEVARLHASSGSKGKPIVVGYTKADLGLWAEVCARSLAAAGTTSADIVQISFGYGLFTGGLGLHGGAELLGAGVVPASSGRTQQQLLLLKDLGATVLCATPSYALNLASALTDNGMSIADLKLRVGVFGAEPWTEEMRKELEDRLSIAALDIYGLTEVIGPGVSMECLAGHKKNMGLHIFEDHFLAEVIDPKSGEVLKEGEEGELVFTTLTKEAQPVLRYRTGDISSLTRGACPCGRTLTRMARVKARIDDMLIIRGVNLYPSEVERVILTIDALSPHYQLVVERVKELDSMIVEVEVSQATMSRWRQLDEQNSDQRALAQNLQEHLKDRLGITAQVTLLKPKSLARSEGKAARVIDKRKRKDNNNGKTDGPI